LYEGIQLPNEEAPIGLITYMRTDSVRVADQALVDVREHIGQQYGADLFDMYKGTFDALYAEARCAHPPATPCAFTYSE
jgi:DNA topoisomerase-1